METTAPVAVFKKRGAKGRANIRKRATTPPAAKAGSGSESSDYSSSEDETGQRVKRRRRNDHGAATTGSSSSLGPGTRGNDLSATVFKADRSVPITDSNDATKRSNWYDGDGADALSTKNLLGSTRAKAPPAAANDDGQQHDGLLYRGLANKTSFVQKNPDAPSRTVGPVKAPTNIRTVTVTDFAPDVCKDVSRDSPSAVLAVHARPRDPHLVALFYATLLTEASSFTATVQANRLLRIRRQLQIPARARGLQGRMAARPGVGEGGQGQEEHGRDSGGERRSRQGWCEQRE